MKSGCPYWLLFLFLYSRMSSILYHLTRLVVNRISVAVYSIMEGTVVHRL